MRATLGDSKDPLQSSIAASVNIAPTDDRFTRLLNSAQQRIVMTGELFWGSYDRVQICVSDSCIVWPREIAAIEAISVCNTPLTIRDQFFSFLGPCAGLENDNCSGGNCNRGYNWCSTMQLHDRGVSPVFAQIIPGVSGVGDKKVKVYADVTEAADAKILILGYDANGNWIRSQVGGEWVDGEYISLNAETPQLSTHIFSSITGVQKPVTNGTIRLYEYDTTLTAQRAIAIYAYDETRPAYRKSFVNGLSRMTGDCGTDDKSLIVMAKLEFIRARVDTDWLMVPNLPALEMAMMAIQKEQRNVWQEAAVYMNGGILGGTRIKGAMGILQDELAHYQPSSTVRPMRMPPRSTYGAGVPNMI